MNAVLKYPGAKWSIADWIISHFPEHRSYLEPFFGSGAVLFTKDRSSIETVNDLDGDVVNFFEWCRRDPERLAHEIHWTPYARQTFDAAFERRSTETDPFRRAVDFCTYMLMGYGYRTTGEKVGWKNDIQGRQAAYAARHWATEPEHILAAAERLRGVQIENRPAAKLIPRFNYPNVLIYADPPYVIESRSCKRKQYNHEMTDDDHVELLDLLKAHKGPVVISGYDSPLYADALRDWNRETRIVVAQSSTYRTETLWMNFEPEGQIRMTDV